MVKASEGSGRGLALLPAGGCYFKLSHHNRCWATEPTHGLLPVWSGSTRNHRMTSMGWGALCIVPPTVIRSNKEANFPEVPNHVMLQTQQMFLTPLWCDLKETKPETFIRFWCQMLRNWDYLMTHLSCHLPHTCCRALRRQRCCFYLLSHSLRHFTSRLTSSCHMI